MKRKTANKLSVMLTALIVLTVTAIVVVGFILAWDVFDLGSKLGELLDTSLYPEAPLCRSDTVVNISFSQAGSLPEKEREALKNYFTCYYASLGSFYHEDIARFFASQCPDQLIDDMTLEHEISVAKSALADYSFKECSVRISVIRRRSIDREKPNTAQLTVQCSSEITYGFSDRPSRVSEEQHTFLITTKNKKSLISGHTTDREARKEAQSALDKVLERAGYTTKDLSYTYYDPYITRASELLKEWRGNTRERFSEMPEQPAALEAEYDYDREAAAAYAREVSHSPDYGEYDENDANFCSQCLVQGGILMDAQGDKLTQWKWYGYEINNARENSGCTKSWFDRESFWTYATENTGFGLAARESERGETGDIVQLMCGDKPALQCVITGTVADKGGNIVDYIVCTDKLKNIPMSLLRTEGFRILHISGYNTANI